VTSPDDADDVAGNPLADHGSDNETCTVAVDVGNTAVKLCVHQAGALVDHAIQIDHPGWHRSAIDWVSGKLGCRHAKWRVASVHRRAAGRLVDAVRESQPAASIHLVTYRDVPMDVCVDEPPRLGIDRLLSAFAAHQICPGPLVVVDAGSAVTVDWVDEHGRFRGGAILPGLGLQARALATGTDALPQIEWGSHRDVRLPATNTADAIHAGILIGVASAIDGLATKYFQHATGSQTANLPDGHDPDGHDPDGDNPEPSLVLTGGDSAVLSTYVQSRHRLAPNLVCRGLLNLPNL
jgi:type III pantothenate kinase